MRIERLNMEKGSPPVNSQTSTSCITSISPQQKNQNRVNISIDGKYAFSLDIAQVVDLKVKVGIDITRERLAELKRASEFGKVYQRALEWSLSRPHSIREAQDYLWRKGREKPLVDVELVLSRLTEAGYIDDEKFARYWVESRFVRRGMSLKRIRLELKQKGVPDTIIEQVLGESGRSDEVEIKKIIEKKRRLYSDEKLLKYLIRQGFNYQLAKEMLSPQTQDF